MFDCSNLYNFVHESIDNLVIGYDDRFFGCDFDESWYFHTFFYHFLNFVDLWNFVDSLYYFFLLHRHLLYLFLDLSCKHWFFLDHFYLSKLLSNIWDYFFNFLDSLMNDGPFFHLSDFLYSSDLLNNFYNFLDLYWHFYCLLNSLFNKD